MPLDISTFNPVTGLPFPTFPEPVYGVGTNSIVGTNPLYGPNGEMGGEVLVNSTTAGNQRFPSVSLDDTGDAVVVWSGNGELAQVDPKASSSNALPRQPTPLRPTVSEVLNAVNVSGTNTVKQIADSAVVDTAPTKSSSPLSLPLDRGRRQRPHSVRNFANWQLPSWEDCLRRHRQRPIRLERSLYPGLESTASNNMKRSSPSTAIPPRPEIKPLAKGIYMLTLQGSGAGSLRQQFGRRL